MSAVNANYAFALFLGWILSEKEQNLETAKLFRSADTSYTYCRRTRVKQQVLSRVHSHILKDIPKAVDTRTNHSKADAFRAFFAPISMV